MPSPSGQRALARSRPPGGRRLRPIAGRLLRPASPGQALVELAVVLPVLLFLLLGALDLGRVFYANITVANAAKEAALRASEGNSDWAAAAANESRGGFVTIATGDVSTNPNPTPCDDSAAFGSTVTATVHARFSAITPYVGALIGGQTITLTRDATAYCAVLPVALGPTPTPGPSPTPTPTPGPTPTPTPTPTPGPTPTPSPTPSPTPTPTPSPTPTPCAAPVASFGSSQSKWNKAVDFDGSGSSPVSPFACAITSWNWTFGDNATGTGQTTSHDYNQPGKSFQVTLTVTSPGGSNSITKLVTTLSKP